MEACSSTSTQAKEVYEAENSESSRSDTEASDEPVTENVLQNAINLEFALQWRDRCDEYMKNGQLDEAFGVLDQMHRLGEEVRNGVFLFKHCVTLLATNRETEYDVAKQRLHQLLHDHIKPKCYEMMSFAVDLMDINKNYFGSLVICEIAFDMFFAETKPYFSLAYAESILQRMKNCISKLVKKHDVTQYFFTRVLLPKMKSIKNRALSLEGIDLTYLCVKRGWLTHCIEVCDSNDETRIETLRECLDYMRSTLNADVNNYQIFGTLANNLGTIYVKVGLNDDAIRCYGDALTCFEKAKDFEDEGKRAKYIRDTTRARNAARGVFPENDDALLRIKRDLENLMGSSRPCITS